MMDTVRTCQRSRRLELGISAVYMPNKFNCSFE
jgi:hypothetical protein